MGTCRRRILCAACMIGLFVWLSTGMGRVQAAEHPLVLFGESDIPALKTKIQSEPSKSWWDTTKSRADAGLSIDFSDVTLSEYDKCLYASCLAFAFLMTDDTLYRDKGIEALTNIGNGSFDGLMFNWHAGVIGTNYGLAYDWLYNEMTPDQIDTVQNKTRGLGEMCQRSISVVRDDPIEGPWYSGDYWTGHGGTHGNQRLLPESGLGIMAIALDDYNNPAYGSAEEWRNFVRDHYFGTTYPELYSPYLEKMTPGGVYNEGFSYHIDSSHALYPYLLAELRRGEITIDRVEPLLNSWVALAMPNFKMPVFEDSFMSNVISDITEFAATSSSYGMEYMWLWKQAQPSSLYASYSKPYLPIIFYDQAAADSSAEPSFTTRFLDGNYIVFRSDWSQDAVYMLVLSQNRPRRLHLQPCQSSFQIYAKGAYLAMDPGYGRENGDSIQNGKAHNLIGVDDIGTARYDSVPHVGGSYTTAYDPAYLREYFTTSFCDFADVEVHYDYYVVSDEIINLGVVISRNYIFPDKKYFVMLDEVSSPDVHDYQWYLHFGFETEGSLDVSGNRAVWQTTNDRSEDVELGAYFVTPAVTITAGQSNTEIFSDTDPQHVYIKAEASASDVDYLTVLFPRKLSEAEPTVETLTDVSGGTGAGIDSQFVLVRDRGGSSVSFQGNRIVTDARLSLTSENASGLDYFMVKSMRSYLYQDYEYISSTSALAAVALQYSASSIAGSIEAPEGGAVITLRSPGIRSVESDGELLELVEHGEDFVVFNLSGKHEIVAYFGDLVDDGLESDGADAIPDSADASPDTDQEDGGLDADENETSAGDSCGCALSPPHPG